MTFRSTRAVAAALVAAMGSPAMRNTGSTVILVGKDGTAEVVDQNDARLRVIVESDVAVLEQRIAAFHLTATEPADWQVNWDSLRPPAYRARDAFHKTPRRERRGKSKRR